MRQCPWSGNRRLAIAQRTFLLFLMVMRVMPGTGFMPSFWMALRLFFSARLALLLPELVVSVKRTCQCGSAARPAHDASRPRVRRRTARTLLGSLLSSNLGLLDGGLLSGDLRGLGLGSGGHVDWCGVSCQLLRSRKQQAQGQAMRWEMLES